MKQQSSTAQHVSFVDERIAMRLLDTDVPDIILNMRKLMGKPGSSSFDVFWNELGMYITLKSSAQWSRRAVMGKASAGKSQYW